MQVVDRLGATELRAIVTTFRDALRAHQEGINRLNVFPVPDGDTGTNMALTMESVVAAVAEAGPEMAPTCRAVSHGSLMGARGNSGVILSQILRGVATRFADGDGDSADAMAVADALCAASEGAYGAVMRPVEGTILTVAREASDAARSRAAAGGSLVEVLDAARDSGARALERTPELLPVLKEAGVVDAGGCGFLLLLDAALHVVAGRPVPEPQEVSLPRVATHASVGEAHDAVSDLRYEVMYFLEASDETIPAFKGVWAGIGDSIVVVGGEGLWNCHIHTDDIGASIEAALDVGRPRDIRVTDLMEQVLEEERWVREAPVEEARPLPAVTTAVVAVATGDGIRRIFHSLGVQAIVAGGQSMNPSTAQLIEAVERVNADQVAILPNNKNIIAVAEQVDALATKSVRVVPTRGIAEGFAALLAYDPGAGVDENRASMTEAAGHVVAGEITRAVRPSACDVGPIAEGDFLGIAGSGIRAVQATLVGAATALLADLIEDEHEIVTLIEGEGSRAGSTRAITEWLHEHHPDVQVEVHHGGQPLYPYLVGIE